MVISEVVPVLTFISSGKMIDLFSLTYTGSYSNTVVVGLILLIGGQHGEGIVYYCHKNEVIF